MSDHHNDVADRLSRVREKEMRRGPGMGGVALLLIGAVVIGAIGYHVAQSRGFTFFGTSEPEEFQRGAPVGKIDIPDAPTLTKQPRIDVKQLTVAPPAPLPEPDTSHIEQAMLDMAEQLKVLQKRREPKPDETVKQLLEQNRELIDRFAKTTEQHQRELAAQRDSLTLEMDSKLAALQAQLDQANTLANLQQTRHTVQKDDQADRLRQARLEEERRKAEELVKRQIESDPIVYDEGTSRRDGGAGEGSNSEAPQRPRNQNEQFFNAASTEETETTVAGQLEYPEWTIVEGTFLHGVLETAIDTSLPGSIRAVISRDVYSFDGANVLLPRGSRLIGTYRSDFELAQERAMVVWQRAVTPEGATMQLASTGTDRLGRAGIGGDVDTHFLERFGSAALISIIGAVPQALGTVASADDTTVDTLSNISSDFRGTVSGVLADYLRIQPTLHVGQGDEITVFAGRDLVVFQN